MSTTLHAPSPSLSSTDFTAFRSQAFDPADSSFSPSALQAATPARKHHHYIASRHNSPVLMLTPSPLRRRTDLGVDDSPMQIDLDDFSNATVFSTPYRAPLRPFAMQRNVTSKRGGKCSAKVSNEDDDGLFLAPLAGHTSLPLVTPERHSVDFASTANSVFAQRVASNAPKRKVSSTSYSLGSYCLTKFFFTS